RTERRCRMDKTRTVPRLLSVRTNNFQLDNVDRSNSCAYFGRLGVPMMMGCCKKSAGTVPRLLSVRTNNFQLDNVDRSNSCAYFGRLGVPMMMGCCKKSAGSDTAAEACDPRSLVRQLQRCVRMLSSVSTLLPRA